MAHLDQDDHQGGHARRVMQSYERWLREDPTLSVLSMVAMFDRPVRREEIAALRGPPIPGLTGRLRDVDAVGWSRLVQRLRAAHLLLPATQPKDADQLDAHPLVREYFAERLRRDAPEAWTDGNARLYEFFRGAAMERP